VHVRSAVGSALSWELIINSQYTTTDERAWQADEIISWLFMQSTHEFNYSADSRSLRDLATPRNHLCSNETLFLVLKLLSEVSK